ncbi:MAG TPA: type II toxin-antitoxin system PemK/MazF family toxin [Sphingomonas sp.]|nr:type II toxin-antitoxin system PemK/MazF family toxin [Sphingomonas sp.]
MLFRVPVDPDETNGLLKPSEVEVDKITTIGRGKVRGVIGRMDEGRMNLVDAALRRWLGL